MTNFSQSVSKVNDRLFLELTEIADWKSRSKYLSHSNLGKNVYKGHLQEF